MVKRIGILTAGSDSPGLNAAIRAIGKSARSAGWEIIGFKDGFEGLVNNETVELGGSLSGILTTGGTILGTSRETLEEPHANAPKTDLLEKAGKVYRGQKLSSLICIGGRETQQGAFRLAQNGMNVITLPKAADNDLAETENAIGFDTALSIATEAIDRLHSTAFSSHRIIIVEIMGRRAGWLALGAGVAGGADVILIPEIPYDLEKVAAAIAQRNRSGKRFSIVAVSEGAVPKEYAEFFQRSHYANELMREGEDRQRVAEQLQRIEQRSVDNTSLLANRLEKLTGLSTRITILGYLLRGGLPSALDRLLATQLGTISFEMALSGQFGVMAAVRSGKIEPVPLEKVHDCHKPVPPDHTWIQSARQVETVFGD